MLIISASRLQKYKEIFNCAKFVEIFATPLTAFSTIIIVLLENNRLMKELATKMG